MMFEEYNPRSFLPVDGVKKNQWKRNLVEKQTKEQQRKNI